MLLEEASKFKLDSQWFRTYMYNQKLKCILRLFEHTYIFVSNIKSINTKTSNGNDFFYVEYDISNLLIHFRRNGK